MIARRRAALLVALCLGPAPAAAQGLETSLRPLARPVASLATSGAVAPSAVTDAASVRPRLRPVRTAAAEPDYLTAVAFAVPRPPPRPRGLATGNDERAIVTAAAVLVPPSKTMTRSKKGSVCGDPSIRGEVLAPITARIKGCGVAEPVRVTSVAGVRLSEAAIMDCPTASALKAWVNKGLKPAFPKTDVVELRVAAHYSCRPRNNQTGAKISEHGKGRAIDLAAIVLDDGRVLTVGDDWGNTLRRVYKAACGIFGTTLGPGSDGYHEEHMHFDTARYRAGSYCR